MYCYDTLCSPYKSVFYVAVFYLRLGIFASFLSVLAKAALRSSIPSIGASGAVCAVLGAFCMLEPQALLCVPLLVNVVPHSFTAGSACYAVAAFEAFGATILARRSPIDHAAHLGGLLFGMYAVIFTSHFHPSLASVCGPVSLFIIVAFSTLDSTDSHGRGIF